MNVLQGKFYSTVFRVIDDDEYHADPKVKEFLRHLGAFRIREGDVVVHCITNGGGTPKTRMQVRREAIGGLLADARPSNIPLEDDYGWIAALQKHLHPDFGIIIVNEGEQEYQTYIASDRAGWTR